MPVNSEGQDIEYTTDETIKDMMEAEKPDFCLEFVGYLAEILDRTYIDKRQSELFKCIITNGSKRINLLIWNIDIMKKLSSELVPGKIVHLDNCKGKRVMLRKYHEDMKLLNYEILIEQKSVVQFMGFHVNTGAKIASLSIPTVEFIDIAKAQGEIMVKAYIKTVVAAACTQSGTMSFGYGSITDGTHKVPLQVASFKSSDSSLLSKGTCVLIRAAVSRSGILSLLCPDISFIKILEDNKMSEKDVIKANKPLKRQQPNIEVLEIVNNKKQRPLNSNPRDSTQKSLQNMKVIETDL